MLRVKTIIALALGLAASTVWAALGDRTGVIVKIETESHTRAGYEDIMYLYHAEALSGVVSCAANWAYFNAKDNPHFVAVVLAARMGERPLRVFVDDQKPKIAGMCQIINMSF